MARKRKSRVPYGSGNVFLRGKLWYVRFRGKKYATGTDDKAAAEEQLAELKRKFNRGEIGSTAADYTVAQLLDDYVKRKKLAPGTRATYESQAEIHLKPFFGLLPVTKLDTDTISDYRDEREKHRSRQGSNANAKTTLGRKISQTSINRELALLRSAMNDLHDRRPKILKAVPSFPMESEKGNARQGFINENEFRTRLYPELPRHLKALSLCAFYCGGRAGDWFGVDWHEVDFDSMLIHFPDTKNKVPRDVPIIPGLMLEALIEAKKDHDQCWPKQPAVFVYQGERLTGIGKAWDKAVLRAGYPDLTFHDLRRSANRFMRDRGVPQGVRMAIMGHLTPSMDHRYGIVDSANLDTAREKMSPRKAKGEVIPFGKKRVG